jgi:hypothetical protein
VSAIEELREGARLMRERAEKATPGPWYAADCEGELAVWRESALRHVIRNERGEIVGYSLPASYTSTDVIYEHSLDSWDEGEDEGDDERRHTASHVASWHPAVALAVADWLEAEARLWEEFSAAVSAWQDRPDFEERTFSTLDQALAVARACLGGETP